MSRLALGLDFGTESVRALAVDRASGDEAAEAVVPYEHGVITQVLPDSGRALPPEFALQDAGDYVSAGVAAIREVLRHARAEDIAGVGVDFTACTMLPIRRDGTPLMLQREFRGDPHAWVKLWKHHAAQPEADRINECARARREPFLRYFSGAISCEWMLPKCFEILRKAPEAYEAADLFIDAGDWIVHRMTGSFVRNTCAAGYKGLWNAELGFPSEEFLAALDPRLAGLSEKWLKNLVPPGVKAGTVTAEFARLSGLKPGTPVSAATIDAHSGVPGMGVCREGPMSIIMGTSSCHMVLSKELRFFDGCAGVVRDGIVPGFYGYESGQAAVGDLFAWFARGFLRVEGDSFAAISPKAAALRPGQTGLLALDWMNGSRSPLMNSSLGGLLLGLTLETKPEEVYRALIEATAFGTRLIVDCHVSAGIPIDGLVVCGGLAKDPLILQTYADVTGLNVQVAASQQAVALGAAIFGALAAGRERGGFPELEEAVSHMTKSPRETYRPAPPTKPVYDRLFAIYRHCHDHFGREHDGLMKELRTIKHEA